MGYKMPEISAEELAVLKILHSLQSKGLIDSGDFQAHNVGDEYLEIETPPTVTDFGNYVIGKAE